ncbi:MAG: MFS transporter [Chloroflexi bacterium]|nr:MFS transporter [Chloroflexota bacterium]
MLAAASVQGMFGNGAISSGFPRFFEPIRSDLGISYTSMSLVFSLARAEGGMGSPLVGWLVDKFGSRPMILFGGLTAGIGLMLLSRADTYWQLVILYVGIVSLGKTAGLGQTLMATVNQWFVRRKAVAISTLMTAFAGGGAIVMPLLHLGITQLGWRDTILYTGIFVALITIPATLVIRSRPEDMGLEPDGGSAPPPRAGEAGPRGRPRPGTVEFTVREALRTPTFWLILAGVVARVSATNAIIVHIFPLLAWKEVSEQSAAYYVTLMFVLAIPLRFVLGVTGGVVSPRHVLFVGMNVGALALAMLWLLEPRYGVPIFIVGMAVVEGMSSPNWIMVGNYFGRSRFASLMGVMSLFHNVGLFISPIFSGWVRDTTGGYGLVLIAFVPLYLISSVCFLLARRPAPPPTASPQAAETTSSGAASAG